MAWFVLMLVAAQDAGLEAAMTRYREATRVEARCSAPGGEEVVVCARRDADRWRVPFVMSAPGDPRHEAVPDERARLIRTSNPCQDMSAFLVRCGMVGVSVTTTGSGEVRVETERALAP